MRHFLNTVFLLLSVTPALAQAGGVTQEDFTGIGNIYIIPSDNWRTAKPEQRVGCLDNSGKFIKDQSEEDCGVFARLVEYPYTLSSNEGNCTFTDENQERNTDSKYGKTDHAWSCQPDYKAEIYDELYTINGFPYPWMCFGDIACFYDAKRAPEEGEQLPLWQFRWGSQQRGITPGHIQLQMMWNKIGDLPKRDGEEIPSPRMQLREGMQVPLQGQKMPS